VNPSLLFFQTEMSEAMRITSKNAPSVSNEQGKKRRSGNFDFK
jgi:hypothetical protein